MQFAQVDFERKDEDIEQNVDDAVKDQFKMFALEKGVLIGTDSIMHLCELNWNAH